MNSILRKAVSVLMGGNNEIWEFEEKVQSEEGKPACADLSFNKAGSG